MGVETGVFSVRYYGFNVWAREWFSGGGKRSEYKVNVAPFAMPEREMRGITMK
jgi:hypothetical protein